MKSLTVTQFKTMCLDERISRFTFSTADQEDQVRRNNVVASLSFPSVFTTLQPNCVVLKNEYGSLRFYGIKQILYKKISDCCILFTLVCGGYGGEKDVFHRFIGHTA